MDNNGVSYHFENTEAGYDAFDRKMQELTSFGGAGVYSVTGADDVRNYFANTNNCGRDGEPKKWHW